MTSPAGTDARAPLRRSLYGILIALSVGTMVGRILAVNSVDRVGLERHLQKKGRKDWRQQRPLLSSNDRSRWATVRALVEGGTYAIDEVVAEPGWDTIDMVQHRDRDGDVHLYSSKPPLLATLVAGPYWIISKLTGWTLAEHPYEVDRTLLILLQVGPLALLIALVARMAERLGTTDWGRLYVVAGAACGTFLTTFVVVLNNHIVAAVSAGIALYACLRIWIDGRRELRYFVLSGLFAALTAASELPALAFFAAVSALLFWKAPRQTAQAYLPAALLVVVAFFATNYAAHDCLTPPYMHRSATDPEDNWYVYTFVRNGRERTSYWSNPSNQSDIDRGEPSRTTYALNVLVGHHGIFSLTPMWLLSVWGIALWCRGTVPRADEPPETVSPAAESPSPPSRAALRQLAAGIAAISLVCLIFYLLRPLPDRNYGGMTSGFRWMFWFAPMWLVVMLPAADRLAARRWTRTVGLLLLALSALSASYPTWNPWTHPWLMNLMVTLEWA
ncbi:MAG: hypothetical protein ACC645_09650 [Pirellulales bacterium]